MSASAKSFRAAKGIPDLSGKVIIVTGGNSGIGKQCVLDIARKNPKQVYLGARSRAKAEEAIKEVNAQVPNAPITFLDIDLASFASIKRAAAQFSSLETRLDILFANAGIMAMPEGLTQDGYEQQFGVNHMGHAYLITLLMPLLEKTAAAPKSDVRIMITTSTGHNLAPKQGIAIGTEVKTTQKNLNTWQRYGQSKLSNVLYAKELARRHPNMIITAPHPGFVATNLADTFSSNFIFRILTWFLVFFAKSTADGALSQLWAGFAPKADVVSGEYYEPVGVMNKGSSKTKNLQLQEELWAWTQKEIAETKV